MACARVTSGLEARISTTDARARSAAHCSGDMPGGKEIVVFLQDCLKRRVYCFEGTRMYVRDSFFHKVTFRVFNKFKKKKEVLF